ncbi:MAG TPA: hypothetical protein VGE47_14120, partial [Burkholderiaceae bacterium]
AKGAAKPASAGSAPMDSMMKPMHEMHGKMTADQMKRMHACMSMMEDGKDAGDSMGMRLKAMEKRMDMLETMLQLMQKREGATPPANQ